MENTYKKRKNLFLQQSYRDSWEDYERSINKDNFITWDYLIITASNEEQAANFREQIAYRQERGLLPSRIHYAVLPDPEGKRVGSGGATLHVMKYIREQEPDCKNPFEGKRILVIHSGGDSKRVPQYRSILPWASCFHLFQESFQTEGHLLYLTSLLLECPVYRPDFGKVCWYYPETYFFYLIRSR